jgi:hypothetical protein
MKATVGMCSFASEERRSRRQSVKAEATGTVVDIIFLGAPGGSVAALLFVVLWMSWRFVVAGQSTRGVSTAGYFERYRNTEKRDTLRMCTCLQIHVYNIDVRAESRRSTRIFTLCSIVVFRQNCELVCLALYCEMISDKELASMHSSSRYGLCSLRLFHSVLL